MPLIYPDNTIWYVQASSQDGRECTEGSAVAIRLQKKGEPNSARTHLLTCGHVVRAKSSDNQPGCGPPLPVIEVWPPGTGYSPQQAREARINTGVKALSTSELAVDERSNVADDWVVLDIMNPQATTAAPTVDNWADFDVSGDFHIYGYVGGESSFPEGKVIPTRMPSTFPLRDEFHGLIRLSGDGTRPGLSGGGVFTRGRMLFAGIHRARADEALQLHVVSAFHIRRRLFELGYELPESMIPQAVVHPGLEEPLREFHDIELALCVSGADWRRAYNLALPMSASNERSSRVFRDDSELAPAVLNLAGLGTDMNGVFPLFRFGHLLGESLEAGHLCKSMLEDWLTTHCPAEQRENLDRSRFAWVRGEPRIVIRMTPANKDVAYRPVPEIEPIQCEPDVASEGEAHGDEQRYNAVFDGERFNYELWFLGFASSPEPQKWSVARSEFGRILENAWSEVCDQHDPRFIWVELFLPKQLLSWAVEKESVRINSFASPVLGARHRFVLRSERSGFMKQLETRVRDAETRSKRRDKPIRMNCNSSLDAVPSEHNDEQNFIVVLDGNPEPKDVATLHFQLLEKTSVLGVIWKTPPEASGADGEPDVWDAAIESGVPLIMWLRELSPEAGGSRELSKHFHNEEWDALPEVVQRLRLNAVTRKADPWHVGRHLAVILDDPQRPLPPVSRKARFCSPYKRN